MVQVSFLRTFLVSVAAMALVVTSSAKAATIAEQNFADRIRLGSSELVLNGVGVRGVAWLKGYAAGLYLTQKASTPAQVLAATGPKRVQMKMLVDVEAKEFVKAFDKGLSRNHTPAEQDALRERSQRFNQNINALGALKPGDVIDLDFVPPRGLVMSVNGMARGSAIPGEDFYAGLLRIFIGERPVDTRLKAGLLGAQ